ncbi:nucleotidyltransferase family protein [Azonexus sp.]|uniref:nucleotidyltransferase family protein n=1 Tax=Azonexus sp. TaxID=1872668 RepID=UPI0035B1B05D
MIIDTVHRMAGGDVRAYVFGSRLDDAARGGDVDLLLASERRIDFLTRARVKAALEATIGLPVDVLSYQTGQTPSPFQQIALAAAVPL